LCHILVETSGHLPATTDLLGLGGFNMFHPRQQGAASDYVVASRLNGANMLDQEKCGSVLDLKEILDGRTF
jgi:hypothetical protein